MRKHREFTGESLEDRLKRESSQIDEACLKHVDVGNIASTFERKLGQARQASSSSSASPIRAQSKPPSVTSVVHRPFNLIAHHSSLRETQRPGGERKLPAELSAGRFDLQIRPSPDSQTRNLPQLIDDYSFKRPLSPPMHTHPLAQPRPVSVFDSTETANKIKDLVPSMCYVCNTRVPVTEKIH